MGPFSQKPKQPVRTTCASDWAPCSVISFFNASYSSVPWLATHPVPPHVNK